MLLRLDNSINTPDIASSTVLDGQSGDASGSRLMIWASEPALSWSGRLATVNYDAITLRHRCHVSEDNDKRGYYCSGGVRGAHPFALATRRFEIPTRCGTFSWIAAA